MVRVEKRKETERKKGEVVNEDVINLLRQQRPGELSFNSRGGMRGGQLVGRSEA